jgi:hypothetical protein
MSNLEQHSFGAMPPSAHAWQTGKTASEIKEINTVIAAAVEQERRECIVDLEKAVEQSLAEAETEDEVSGLRRAIAVIDARA